MDKATQAIKKMYEQYPSPLGVLSIQTNMDAKLLLSYVENQREDKTKPISVLDVGCGRGVNLLSTAILQSDVMFTGIDINSVGLNQALAIMQKNNIKNVTLAEVDVMNMEGLEIPAGGFDVIILNNTLQHLAYPEVGVQNLKKVLANHGVMYFNVPSRFGREQVNTLMEALRIFSGDGIGIEDKIIPAKVFAQEASNGLFKGTKWEEAYKLDDIDIVNEFLNVQNVSYDIGKLWHLLDRNKLKFIRWENEEEWDVEKVIENKSLLNALAENNTLTQSQVIERLYPRDELKFIVAHSDNSPRNALKNEEFENTTFIYNPNVAIISTKRNLELHQRFEAISYRIGHGEIIDVPQGILAQALLLIADQNQRFTGSMLIEALKTKNMPREYSIAVLQDMLDREILIRC